VAGERPDDRADLVRMDAPHPGVAEFLAARRASSATAAGFLMSVVTLCDGTLPCAWQAAEISSLARAPAGGRTARRAHGAAGNGAVVRRDEIHEPNDSDCTCGRAAIARRRPARRGSRSAHAPAGAHGLRPGGAADDSSARSTSARPSGLGNIT
jgi:hypothetical protein